MELDIYGARVSQGGIVLEPNGIPISTEYYEQMAPSVTFDGTRYFVVWEDWRSGWDGDIYGARVLTSGVVVDTYGLELVNQLASRYLPKVLSPPTTPFPQLLLTFEGYYSSLGAIKALGAFYPYPSGIAEEKERFNHFSIIPNPVRDKGVVRFSLSKGKRIKIDLYDVSGKLVKNLYEGPPSSAFGFSSLSFSTEGLKGGVYLLSLKGEREEMIKKVIVVR